VTVCSDHLDLCIILLAQSAKSQEVMAHLDERFVPMPEPMMNEIMAGQEISGSKETIEAQLAEQKNRESSLFYELCRYYKQDTVNTWAHDSLVVLLNGHPALSSKYLLVAEYLDAGDLNRLSQALAAIPQQFELSAEEQNQFQDYLNYFQLRVNLSNQNRTIFELDNDQRQQLVMLANQASEPVQTYARNILLANKLITYNEPIVIPDTLQPQSVRRHFEPQSGGQTETLNIFPNPSNQYVVVEYDAGSALNPNEVHALTVMTADGKTVLKMNLKKAQDQTLIDCREYRSGAYLCRILKGNKVVGTGKFTIVR
jgi:hypothetical protein